MLITDLKNEKLHDYTFLNDMYKDQYFPDFLVDKLKNVLLKFCGDIEIKQPKTLDELYAISNIYVEVINELQNEFWDNESEIETVARETIGQDFYNIALLYNFPKVDNEAIIGARDW